MHILWAIAGAVAASAVAQPNLTPVRPAGWPAPLVVSTHRGDRQIATEIYDDQDLFIDWTSRNTSTSSAARNRCYYELTVDGFAWQQWSSDYVAPGGTYQVDDYRLGRLNAGVHTVRIEVDATQLVPETNEADNTYAREITVLPRHANGHFYALTTSAGTWHQAQAEATSYGGHLSTITSSSEQRFVVGTFLRGIFAQKPLWIGLNDQAQEGVYSWINGESFEYANWNPQEPNNCRGEDYVVINWHVAHGRSSSQLGDWNDAPAVGTDGCLLSRPENYHGIIEWNSAPAGFPGEVYQWTGPVADPMLVWRSDQGGNGHAYQALWVAEGITWDDASRFAEDRGGTLASITSTAENSFVFNLVDAERFWETRGRYTWTPSFGPWLGGLQRTGATEPAGGWFWVTGEVFGYSNWDTSQPDNYGPQGEHCLHYFTSTASARASKWNDESTMTRMPGFVIEFRSLPPQITQVQPNPVMGSNSPQRITITGANFVNKPKVTLTWTQPPLAPAAGYVVPGDRVNFVNNGKLEISIVTGTTPDTWTARVTNPDGRRSSPASFAVQGVGSPPGPSPFGLTIIAHGHQPLPGLPGWVREMARAVALRQGEGNVYRLPIDSLRVTGTPPWTSPKVISQTCDNCAAGAPIFGADGVGAGILIIDWSDLAGGVPRLSTETTTQVADAVFEHLFPSGTSDDQLASVPVHVIGHSRGASLVSRFAYRLARRGIWVEQVTTLDPQPVTLWIGDFEVVTWENVLFADNYYRRGSGAPPLGEQITGSYQLDLHHVVVGDGEGCRAGDEGNGTAHEQVHTYYHGTISTNPPCVDGVEIQTGDWYPAPYQRERVGFYFSRTGGGDRYDDTGPYAAHQGLHHLLGGSGSRTDLETADRVNRVWPNATLKPPASYFMTAGSKVPLTYFYQDADSSMDVGFFLDDDANPFNNEGKPSYRKIGGETNLPSSRVISAPQTFSWIPGDVDEGTWYVQIKASESASDGGRVRYDYLPQPVTITASGQPKSDLVIENLTVTPNQAEPGVNLSVGFTLRNTGASVAYPSHANIRLNASSTAVLPTDRALALDLDLPDLRPGAIHPFTQTVLLPAVGASGTYYLWVIADVRNEANQSDTSDGSDKASATIAITVPPLGGIGDWVEVYGTAAAGLRVRAPEPCDAPLEGAKRPDGRKGLVLDGPRPCNLDGQDYVMWKIHWEDCVLGWSSQDWLRKIADGATMDCDRELRVQWIPDSGGSVSVEPSGPVYRYGDMVGLTAHPADGYYLEAWEGVDQASGLDAQVTMRLDRSVTAQFRRVASDPGCTCPAECAANPGRSAQRAGPDDTIDLNLLRRFRDEVLSATPAGQALIDEFYQNSAEMLHHMAARPAMLGAVQEAIVSLQPTLRDLIEGEGKQTMSEAQVEAVSALAQQLHEAGGVVLRSAIVSELERIGPLDTLAGKTSGDARQRVVGTFVRLLEPRMLDGGTFEFRVTGDVTAPLRVEYSDDLLIWDVLEGPAISQLPVTLQDRHPPRTGHRYYRVVNNAGG